MAVYRLGELMPEWPGEGACWVAPDAVVVGRVRLGTDVGIWFGAVLRGDNEWLTIGDGSNLQEHVMVHSDMGFPVNVGRGCTIGHRALLHGCTIGDNSLVGMGAIVMNGATIGANSIVAAGALVPEGKSFPDGSLILGVPGKLARPLRDEEIEGNRRSATGYRAKGRLFAQDFVRV